MPKRELGIEPHRSQYLPPRKVATIKKYPGSYRPCPICGEPKRWKAKNCQQCNIVGKRPPIDQTIYIIDGDRCRYLPLQTGEYAIIDECEYHFAAQWSWRFVPIHDGYSHVVAAIKIRGMGNKRHTVKLHRLIMNSAVQLDHINRNPLDNRRRNLRECNFSQNKSNSEIRRDNTSGYIGVHLNKRDGVWVARVSYNRKRIFLGRFTSPEEAAIARDLKALELHKEFAVLNFPEKKGWYEQQLRT
jgi:hypothetical protein